MGKKGTHKPYFRVTEVDGGKEFAIIGTRVSSKLVRDKVVIPNTASKAAAANMLTQMLKKNFPARFKRHALLSEQAPAGGE